MDSKLSKWTERLLDLGRRNKLINYKDTKGSGVDILLPDLDKIYMQLSNAETLELLDPFADKKTGKDMPRDPDDLIEMFTDKLANNKVLIYSKTETATKALRGINRTVKDIALEKGVNVLYAAFGFLKWVDKKDNVPCISPLVLVPIRFDFDTKTNRYKIVAIENEETNPTLTLKLFKEYNFNLPQIGDTEELSAYLTRVRADIAQFGWSADKQAVISTFYYFKINMYLDLTKNEPQVLANPIMKTLLLEENEVEPMDEETLRQQLEEVDEGDLHNVVDADRSQNDAIALALLGKSFVLQGPPGTGKSQTITNIIAECLAAGKKVLFVSEKQAALNVVLNNLRKVDLADYCLAMTTVAKADKVEIIAELNNTLSKPRLGVSGKANKEIAELKKIREKLDSYVKELHTPVDVIGLTTFELFAEKEKLSKFKHVNHTIPEIGKKTTKHLDKAKEVLTYYGEKTQVIGRDFRKNPWYGFNKKELELSEKRALPELLSTSATMMRELAAVSYDIENEMDIVINNFYQARVVQRFFQWASGLEHFAKPLFVKSSLPKLLNEVEGAAQLIAQATEKKEYVNQKFKDDVFGLDRAICQYLSTTVGAFKTISKEYRTNKNLMFATLKAGQTVKKKEIKDFATVVIEYLELTDRIEAIRLDLQKSLGEFVGDELDVKSLKELLMQATNTLEDNFDYTKCTAKFEEDFEGAVRLARKYARSLKTAYNRPKAKFDKLQAYFDLNLCDFDNMKFVIAAKKFDDCGGAIDVLPEWMNFLRLLDDIRSAGLVTYLYAAIDDKAVKPQEFAACYCLLFYDQWANHAIKNNELLYDFQKVFQDKAVKDFADKDKLLFEVNKAIIGAKLSSEKPSANIVADGSDVSILRKEGEKKRKQMPLRLLFAKIPKLIQTLKPCFLMSPLTVSTFLESQDLQFDVVIFDEASQIFPEDAIGAIYRAKQLIVVGDSKQMPPSSFFNSIIENADDTSIGDDYDEDYADYESILDLCAARFYNAKLKWHFRSRSEELISFSNTHFYSEGNTRLLTFPAPGIHQEGFGVDFYKVEDGYFDSTTRSNPTEAKVVALRVAETREKYPDRSVGVVAFGIGQQKAIEAEIASLAETDPRLKDIFQDSKEPFFVKNLETVQGDERDVIIFSIGYSKGKDGRLRLNFGPILKPGGERRLNVAITRAKYNVQVVSSVSYGDFHGMNTRSKGAEILVKYLEYAENGAPSPIKEERLNRGENEFFNHNAFDFEPVVAEFLRSKGYEVVTQLGNSDYPIDIAVKHPTENRYVLAIECDGDVYNSFKSTRDRDRLRREVLERLGWNYYRMWSTEWEKNNAKEKEKLLAALNKALNGANLPKPTGTVTPKVPFVVEQVEKGFDLYEYADYTKLLSSYSRSRNFERLIKGVLKTENPVSKDLLLYKIVAIFNSERVTAKVREQFNVKIDLLKSKGLVEKDGFLYLDEIQPILPMRVPKEGDVPREITQISIEELAGGVLVIIEQNVSVDKTALARALSQVLKYARISEAVVTRVDVVLKYLMDMGLIKENEGAYSVIKEE